MTTVHAISTVSVAEASGYLRGARVIIPSKAQGMPDPPHLLIVQMPGDFAAVQGHIREAERLSGGKVMALPHPRDPAPLHPEHLGALKGVVPNLAAGHTMRDLLTNAYADCPTSLLDPSLFCF